MLALAAVALAACTSQNADREDVANALEEAGASEEQADCVAEGLEDDLSQDELNEVADASDLEDLDNSLRESVDAVLANCLSSGNGGDGDDSTDTTDESTTTTEG